MNITDATNLFIVAEGDYSELFKVTNNGKVQKVTYSVTSDEYYLQPRAITVLNPDYFIIEYGPSYYSHAYLVNSKTGACYLYNKNDLPNKMINDVYGGEFILSDENGNIYFINGEYKLRKMSIADPNNVTISTYSVANDDVRIFGVDKYGNVAYWGYDAGGNNILRYKKAAGGLENLPGSNNLLVSFWQGLAGELFYSNTSIAGSKIKKLQASPFSADDYGSVTLYGGIDGVLLLKMKKKNAIVAVVPSGIYDLYNSYAVTRMIPYSTFSLDSKKFGIASDNFYYLIGKGTDAKSVLLKIDPSNDNHTRLINGEYDIYKASVSDDDVITFNAIRMSDGAIVLGEISVAGNITILDENLTSEVIDLARIR